MEIDLDSVLAAKGMAKDDPRLKKKIQTKNRNIIAGKITDWKSCAAYLEVSDQDVYDIVEENKMVRHQRRAMLRLWWETNGNEATYLRLAKALASIGRRDLIEELLTMMHSIQVPQPSFTSRFVRRMSLSCLVAGVFSHWKSIILIVLSVYVLCTRTVILHESKDDDCNVLPKNKELNLFTLNQTLCDDILVPHDLPIISKEIFVGREEERREIIKMMDTVHIIGIHGAPGFGKSTLAIHVGYEMLSKGAMVRYVDVVDKFFHLLSFDIMPDKFDSASVHDNLQSTVPQLQAHDRGFSSAVTVFDHVNSYKEIRDTIMQGLLRWSKTITCRTVLVLDNCNGLIKNLNSRDTFIRFVRRLIQNSGGNLFVIFTSRQKIVVLDDFNSILINELSTNVSRELLSKFSPNISREDAELIVSRLDGCPLALKVVGKLLHFSGGRMSQLLRDELEKRPLLVFNKTSLSTDNFLVIMKSVFDHLANLQACGFYISFFPGSFSYVTGMNVIPDMDPLIQNQRCIEGLVEQSLVEEYYLANQTRYKMHKLIREFFKEVGLSQSYTYSYRYNLLLPIFNKQIVEHFTRYLVHFADKLQKSASAFDDFVLESEHHNIHYALQLLLLRSNDLSVVELRALAFAVDRELISVDSIVESELLHIMIGKIDEMCDVLSAEKCGEVFSRVIRKFYMHCRCESVEEYFKQFFNRKVPCIKLFQCDIVSIVNQSDHILIQLSPQEKSFISRMHRLYCGGKYRVDHFLYNSSTDAIAVSFFLYLMLFDNVILYVTSDFFFVALVCSINIFYPLMHFIYYTFVQHHHEKMVWMTVYFPALIQILMKVVLFILCVLLRYCFGKSLNRLDNERCRFGVITASLLISLFEVYIFWNVVPYCY